MTRNTENDPPYELAILSAQADADCYRDAHLATDQDNPVIHVVANGHIVARHWFREGT